MDNVYAGKGLTFYLVTKTKDELNQDFRKSIRCCKDGAAMKIPRKFPGVAKAGTLLPGGGICHPMPPHGYGPGSRKSNNMEYCSLHDSYLGLSLVVFYTKVFGNLLGKHKSKYACP